MPVVEQMYIAKANSQPRQAYMSPVSTKLMSALGRKQGSEQIIINLTNEQRVKGNE